jgi:hypothetical protein
MATVLVALALVPTAVASAHAPSPPEQLRQEIRGCHALLGDGAAGKRCVRSAVKRAKAGCREYKSERRETRCLRHVRRVARSAAS